MSDPLVQLDGPPRKSAIQVETAVANRYSAASREMEPSLCCAVEYEASYLDALPDEIVQRDYGCGDPSRHVAEGETALDLGCGGGKICYIASQIVGPQGRVVGVDINDDMLDLARRHQPEIARRIGYSNVEFRKGRIQDLALDLEQMERWLREHPVSDANQWLHAQRQADQMRRGQPMIADDSIDVVMSNCVLNLVDPRDRRSLFAEIYRVLTPGGRAVISDITCDEPVPESLRNDPKLWSGCISGAFLEVEFLQAFAAAGFHGMEILDRHTAPWAVVERIEFRSMTVRAYKRHEGPSRDHRQAVIYQGPWRSVTDDDGNVLRRGERMATSDKNFQMYIGAPYRDAVIAVPPAEPVAPEDATPYDCPQGAVRDPRQTKGKSSPTDVLPEDSRCGETGCC